MRGIGVLKERLRREIRRRSADQSDLLFNFVCLKPDDPIPESSEDQSFTFAFYGDQESEANDRE